MLLLLLLKMVIKNRDGEREKEKLFDANNNAKKWHTIQLLYSEWCRVCSKNNLHPLWVTPPVYILTFCGVEYLFGQIRLLSLVMLPLSFLGSSSLAKYETSKTSWLRIVNLATTKTLMWFNIILIMNPKHSTLPAIKKKTISIPAKTRVPTLFYFYFIVTGELVPNWE